MLETGVIIFALGHPYYGRYAYNLAITIKAVENIPIAIVHDDTSLGHLSEDQTGIFDHRILSDLKPGCASKLHAYELSPFERTLLLDADMAWLPKRKPSDLFDQLNGIEFTGITEGSTTNPSGHYFFWAEVQDIRDTYNIDGVIHQWRTEVLYFERSEKCAAMFSGAIEIYKDHKLSKVKTFAEGVPDELAINISAAVHDVHPHVPNWSPSYWAQLHSNELPELNQLYTNYYTLSIGGNHTSENVKRVYNNIVKAQGMKLGLGFSFSAQSKHQFLPERRKS